MPMNALGYAAQSPTSDLAPFQFERREPRPDDVSIDILYCGVCHSVLCAKRDCVLSLFGGDSDMECRHCDKIAPPFISKE